MTTQAYIEEYSSLAMEEMMRSGVPASITLAQGILESSSGNSRLAKEANNHFGIKCKGNWNGKTIYADDDRPQECFRAYPSVFDSYADHSDFLRENQRYSILFELSKSDYKNWAKGLKSAGYATNPKYANILISLIERYNLDKFDMGSISQISENGQKNLPKRNNHYKNIIYRSEKSLEDLAVKNGLTLRKFYRINDLPLGSYVKDGAILYLEPKGRKATKKYHYVNDMESMHEISQWYGIRLRNLYKLNRMNYGTQPAKGQRLFLKKRRSKKNQVLFASPKETEIIEAKKNIEQNQGEEEKTIHQNATQTISTSNNLKLENVDGTTQKNRQIIHVVKKGETLYGIAINYQVTVENIQEWNQLKNFDLKMGQELKILK